MKQVFTDALGITEIWDEHTMLMLEMLVKGEKKGRDEVKPLEELVRIREKEQWNFTTQN